MTIDAAAPSRLLHVACPIWLSRHRCHEGVSWYCVGTILIIAQARADVYFKVCGTIGTVDAAGLAGFFTHDGKEAGVEVLDAAVVPLCGW